MIIEWFQIFHGPDFWLTVLLGAQIGGRMPTVTQSHPEPLPPSVHSQPCFQNSCLGQFFWLRYIRIGMFENGWKIFIIPSLKWSWFYCLRNSRNQASLVAQWLRVCLPMQGTRVWALVWEDPTCHGATGPVRHNYWACASGACAPQQERPRYWGARAPRWRVAPACRNWGKPSHRNEDPTQP